MRTHARRALERALEMRTRILDVGRLQRVVVVAPHFDDELLGCGGTLLRLLAQGSSVRLVYMTDGGKSHGHLIADIARIRADEAREVGAALGIGDESQLMLGYPERGLAACADVAADALTRCLESLSAQAVFGPYGFGEHVDHAATCSIVRAAISRASVPIDLYEYPVWAWHHWPWVPLELPSRSDIFSVAWGAWRSNVRLFADMNVRVPVEDFSSKKLELLNLYRSQMTRLIDDEAWMTLHNVAGGRFLENFFGPHEYFYERSSGRK